MARIAITDTGGLDFSPGIAVLNAAGHDTILLHEGEGLLTHLADLEGLIVSFCRIDASVIAAAPLLKVIVTTTTGLDQIDMHAAKAAGIAVFSLPSPATEEVATHALAGILTLLREIPAAREASKCWDFKKFQHLHESVNSHLLFTVWGVLLENWSHLPCHYLDVLLPMIHIYPLRHGL
ncbi:hypothetical protein PYR74_24225 [Acinetobacter bereziniae]|nr:hypothetical protein PYR74_24225 [Acinetobacter bereziniae]